MSDTDTSLPNAGMPADGPAFPLKISTSDGSTTIYPGMMLRDWFAGQALAGMVCHPKALADAEGLAGACYEIADAMLAARMKGGTDAR